MTVKKREGFFGTDNLHRAGWAALVGVAGFCGALVYQKVYGPQRVVVEWVPEAKVTTEVVPRAKDVVELTTAINKLAQATARSQATAGPSDKKRLLELAAEVDQLRAQVGQARRPGVATAGAGLPVASAPLGDTDQAVQASDAAVASSASAGVASSLAPDVVPVAKPTAMRFKLPDTVRGHTQERIFGVSGLNCPPSRVVKGAAVSASFTLVDASVIDVASPLRVTIDKVRSKYDHLQVDERWAALERGQNSISMTPSLESGTYQLTYGFFRKDKLTGGFPPFYSKVCEFDVQ